MASYDGMLDIPIEMDDIEVARLLRFSGVMGREGSSSDALASANTCAIRPFFSVIGVYFCYFETPKGHSTTPSSQLSFQQLAQFDLSLERKNLAQQNFVIE